ncbi:hypothetical protein BGZ76_005054, partial [Entomortierella beljakovae]
AAPRDHEARLLKSLFEPKDSVDDYFFNNPASKWDDIGAYCKTLLENNFKTSCQSAFKTYQSSLSKIKGNAEVGQTFKLRAGKALSIRESRFRSQYFIEEANVEKAAMANSKKFETNVEVDGQNNSLYLPPLDDPLQLDLNDLDYYPSSQSSHGSSEAVSEKSNEDLTGEIPEPINVDRLVGPGTFSSQLSEDPKNHLIIGNHNISQEIMKYRRKTVIEGGYLADKEDLLLTNFIIMKSLLVKLCPKEIVDKVFPPVESMELEASDLQFIGKLSAKATNNSFDELNMWLSTQMGIMTSLEWANTNWNKAGCGNNEDTFTSALLKPLLTVAFGHLIGSRDLLRSGQSEDPDNRRLFPDYQISYKSHALMLGEFKTAVASKNLVEEDFIKLSFMGKKAVDGLHKDGFALPVVLVHGRGMEVDVYKISLNAEATYVIEFQGTFQLISRPSELSLLLGVGPLISAQVQ